MISIKELFETLSCPKEKNRFIIHEHHADKAGLHFDIRIEKDCVLKSWATRKLDLLLNLKVKKIQLFPTPDHDLSWINFSGYIDDGYGKGLVKIFDKGTFKTLKWTENSIVIDFNGRIMKGIFIIIKTKNDSYLMFKKV